MAAIGIAVVLLVGVALTSGGQPMFTANTPVAGHPVTPLSTLPTTTAPVLPPRPGNLPLDRVDPCTILTRAQRAELSLDSPPSAYVDPEFAKAPACSIRGRQSGTVARLALVTTMGVDVWLSDTAQVDARPVTSAGYPALVVRTPGLTDACNVEVDVAQNEFLDVLFRDGGYAAPIPQDTLCLGAQRVAEAAVTSLRASA